MLSTTGFCLLGFHQNGEAGPSTTTPSGRQHQRRWLQQAPSERRQQRPEETSRRVRPTLEARRAGRLRPGSHQWAATRQRPNLRQGPLPVSRPVRGLQIFVSDTRRQCMDEGMAFIPVIIEAVGGGLGPQGMQVIAELAKASASASGEPADTNACFTMQRLSLVLHRENARAVLRRRCRGG